MKKFLSLVLALTMAMSLVTISAGAKDFTDDSKITYKEAVDVISAIGVVDGYTDGAFNPSNTLTRGAAAKIICNMVLGPTAAGALGVTAAPFKDVAVNNVFAGYIAYCSAQGIINGYPDGTFRPAATVTGFQFLKMLLGALGYDATIEKFTGNNYTVQVAKLATNLKLTKGNGSFVGTKAMTREEACLYAFNTLKATMVEYANKGTNIVVNGITISQGASAATKVETSNDDYRASKAGEKNNDGYLQFCEQYFSKLKLNDKADVVDTYGRPAHKWTNDKDKVGTYADTAALTYTTGVKGTTLVDDIDDAGYDLPEKRVIPTVRNGSDPADVDYTADLKSSSKLGGNGIVIELYADDDDVINKVVVIATYLAEVTAVTKDKTSTKSIDESALTLKYTDANGKPVTGVKATADDDTIGFAEVYANVEKGDMVLITPENDNTKSNFALSVAIPETVVGPLTRSTSSSVRVGGTTYDLAEVVNETYKLTSKDVTLYLDQYGYAIGCDASSISGGDDSSVAVLKKYQSLNDDGELVKMIKGVTSDGATVTWEIDDTTYNSPDIKKDTVCTYEEKDDVYTLTVASNTTKPADGKTVVFAGKVGATGIKTSTKSLYLDSARCYFNDDVKFIFVNDGKAVMKDGVQKVDANTKFYAVINNDGGDYSISAMYVMSGAANSSTTSDDLVYVVGKSTGEVNVIENGKDKTYYSYDAYVEGELVEDFYAKSSTVAEGFYTIEIDDETGAYITSGNAHTDTSGDVAVVLKSEIAKGTKLTNNLLTIGSGSSAVDYDLESAVIVDAVNDDEITTIDELETALESGKVTVSFLYNDDDNTVSYLYVVG